MFSKYSVKKPYTVLVAVILIIVLGVISFTGMTTDLLPSIELPYIIVVTTYPGASPEKIEATVTKPLESVLGTTNGIKKVTSTSSENSSMVMLEFVQGTNMDSATIELSGNIDLVAAQLPDEVSAPMLLKISPDMLPIMVTSVDVNGMDVKGISKYASEVVIPAFERVDGVASVDASGIIKSQLSITLNQSKIDDINNKVLASVSAELSKAQKELTDGKNKIIDGQNKLADGKKELTTNKDSTVAKLAAGSAEVDSAIASLNALLAEETTISADKAAFEAEKKGYQQVGEAYTKLNAGLTFFNTSITDLSQMTKEQFDLFAANIPGFDTMGITHESVVQLEAANTAATARLPQIEAELNNISMRLTVLGAMKPKLQQGLNEAKKGYEEIEKGKMVGINEITKAEVTISSTEAELKKAEESLNDAQEKFDESRDAALEKADISGVITADMIANILKAQNFGMPAGYIQDGTEKYLVKVGDQFKNADEIKNLLLMNIDIENVGNVLLSDVADIEMADNSAESYAKINGNDGVVLTFQKQSTASTADVSNKIAKTISELTSKNPDLHITALMDQGDYIDLIVNSVLQNLIFGGILAIFVLALFLKDFKPTIIVACSIPLSLLFAITLMYFSKISLNIISLSGLALGVGMLVDNSIVVIENIYRLRSEGMPAAKAAVKGAVQVSGAIFASTLTTVCVFLPIVFTQGLSRQLFTDMGLTIAYSLLASLIVALTLVPAMGATILKNTKEKDHKLFDKFVNAYAKVLTWCLKHKAVTLVSILALFVFSIYQTTQMGTEFIPEMQSPQMSATVKMPKGTKRDDAYKLADDVLAQILEIKDVETVGLLDGGSGMSIMGMGGSGANASATPSFSAYILVKDGAKMSNAQISAEISEKTKASGCTIDVQESNMNMSALGGSGVQLVIKGRELDQINAIADDLRSILTNVEGVSTVSQPAQGNIETRITVDKDKAMLDGLTVAQVYGEIASALKSDTSATILTQNSQDYPVVIYKSDKIKLSKDNLLDFEIKTKDKEGKEKLVALKDIASVEEKASVSSINRENSVRTMSVTATIDENHNIGLVGRDVEKLLKDFTPPEGYTVEMLGENESINSAIIDLVLMISLAIVFIYLIMVAQFQSLISPLIVMFTIPLAFTGGLLGLWFTGKPISVISLLGFLVLAGIVVNNGIVFVDYINQLRLEGMDKHEALITTGKARVRPVLMTALTTILAMSTMAIGTGMGAEMSQPMAIVTIGGLSYATVLTLVVVPVMYDILRRKPMINIDIDDE